MTQQSPSSTKGNRWGSNTRWVQQDEGRRAILNAAMQCFERQGMNSTTIDEIARTANITRRTVYHYFKSKNEILEAAVEQHACDCINRMIKDISGEQPFTDFIIECLLYMIEHIPEEPFYKIQTSDTVGIRASYFYFTSSNVQKIWLDAFQAPYIEALRQRSINPQLLLEDIMMWIGRIALSYLQYPNPQHSKENVRRELEHFFINALKYSA